MLTLARAGIATVDGATQAIIALQLARLTGLGAALWVRFDVGALAFRTAEIAFIGSTGIAVITLAVAGAGGALTIGTRIVACLALQTVVGVVAAVGHWLVVTVATDAK